MKPTFYIFIVLLIAASYSVNAQESDNMGKSNKNTQDVTTKPLSFFVSASFVPFDVYPTFGFSAGIQYNLKKLGLGAMATYYLPEPNAYSNVERNITLFNVYAQKDIRNFKRINWYVNLGLGVGIFKDDFKQVYDDVSQTSFGFVLGTGIEYRTSGRLKPFFDIRFPYYFANDVTDNLWSEFVLGVKF